MSFRLSIALRAILCSLVLLVFPLGQLARADDAQSVPHSSRSVPVDPDALAVKQKDLLKAGPRVEGFVIIPSERAGVLIQPAGRVWRYFHEEVLHWGGAAILLGVIALLALAYLVMGRMRISAGRSGWRILRFTSFERFAHWLTAISFVFLGLTGLNITFGKLVLMPLIGHEAFGDFSAICKYVHNFVSFAFVLGLILIAVQWMKDNFPNKVDLVWIKEGGGFIKGKHPTAGRFNAGEKLVFWFALGAGTAVAVSGYLLLFPFYVTDIAGMQIAQVVHAVIAVFFIAVILGHIYIGTLGMEGAFEAMQTGSVDLNWAEEHHGLWVEEERRKGNVPVPPSQGLPPGQGLGQPAE